MLNACASALALSAVLAASTAQGENVFSLRDALAAAYQTNPQLEAERANLRATDENVAQANGGWRPTISFQGSYGFQRTLIGGVRANPLGPPALQNNTPLTGTLAITQPIFRGGRTFAEIGVAKSQVQAERAQLVNVEEGVLLNAVTAYMDVVRDAAIVNFKTRNVAALQEELNGTREEFGVREVTRTDVSQAQARLAGAQADLANAIGQLRTSRSYFERFVGRPAMVLEQHPLFPDLPGTEQAAITESLAKNPALVSAKEQERATNYAIDDAAGALLPQLSIQGQYQYAHDEPDTGVLFGIGRSEHVASVVGQLPVPIYQGGAEDAAVRQAEQRDAAANHTIANTQRSIVDATKTAWDDYVAAEAAIASNKTQQQADSVALDSVRQEQKFGSRTVLDVLNAEQELLNAQVAVASSERDACVAAFQILSAMGRLTAKYLGLSVKLYNPKAYYDENHASWFGLGDN